MEIKTDKQQKAEKQDKIGEILLRVVTIFFIFSEIAAIFCLWKQGYIQGIKPVLLSVGCLLFSRLAMELLDTSQSLIVILGLPIFEIYLARCLFPGSLVLILSWVFVMIGWTILARIIRHKIIKKYGLYWHTPFGAG